MDRTLTHIQKPVEPPVATFAPEKHHQMRQGSPVRENSYQFGNVSEIKQQTQSDEEDYTDNDDSKYKAHRLR